MCTHCSYHASAEWEMDSALADADDATRQAYWDAQDHRSAAEDANGGDATADQHAAGIAAWLAERADTQAAEAVDCDD